VAIPALILAGANAWRLWKEHWEHWEYEERVNPRSQRPEYQYQNVRTKNFPWGDGDKVCAPSEKTVSVWVTMVADGGIDAVLERQGELP
jgi:cytochrome c oxidase subunit 6a